MSSTVKAGGIASLVQALCYVFGFASITTFLNPGDTEGWTSVQKLEFILDQDALFQIWNVIIYVVFGIALVVLTTALHGLLKTPAPQLMTIATPFGYIWSGLVIASGMVASVGLETISQIYLRDPQEAANAWVVIATVQNGLGGGVEIVGGIWVLLLSVASMRTGAILPKLCNWLGVLVGLAGLVTIIPMLSDFGAIFGLLQIFWFITVGIALLRTS